MGAFHGVKDFEGDFVGSSALVSRKKLALLSKSALTIKIFEFCNLGSLRSGKICLQNPLCGSLDTHLDRLTKTHNKIMFIILYKYCLLEISELKKPTVKVKLII